MGTLRASGKQNHCIDGKTKAKHLLSEMAWADESSTS